MVYGPPNKQQTNGLVLKSITNKAMYIYIYKPPEGNACNKLTNTSTSPDDNEVVKHCKNL